MPDSSLQAYLASKYLSGPKADAILARTEGESGKKRRKKHRSDEDPGSSSFRLVDHDDQDWKRRQEEEADEAQTVVLRQSERNEKKRWTKLGGNAPVPVEEAEEGDEAPQMASLDGQGLNARQNQALQDALAAQVHAAAATAVQKREPQGEHEAVGAASAPPSASPVTAPKKPQAGLRTREEMRAERLERERKAAAAEQEQPLETLDTSTAAEAKAQRTLQAQAAQQETVYRDASGRRIDVEQDNRERKAKAQEEKRMHKERKEWTKGDVQRKQRKEAQRKLEEAKKGNFARGADDRAMNAELRSLERASDPALAFLTKKRDVGPQKPRYTGPAPAPNRFGIAPGYRWDGVDRGNGFENKLFQRMNERKRRGVDEQAWRQEDM